MQEDEKKEKTNVPRPKASNRDHSVGAVVDEDRILGLDKEYSGWDVYNNEAKKVDMELVKDWTSSLNFLLVFAAIFAAVLTAFIIESKKLLEQDSTSVMAEVMIFYTNNVANGTHTPYIPVDFQPKVTDVIVNCLFYASLSASLVAALASVVSLQWVADYDAAITRGGSSPEDRAKRRQFRYAGVISWKMNEVIAALPLLLYFSVILFFAGLILWMWTVNYIVGTVIATGAGVAVLFYATSTLVAVAFVSAPFRTPLSRWIYSLSRLPFSFIYRILRIAHVTTVPEWLEQAHRSFTIAYKREDEAVKTRVGLARDALVWLAGHLSISQDSYRRLLLLAGELPNLEHMPSFTRAEGDWYTIFDLLGWKYLSPNHVDNITTEDIEGMAVLQRCCMLPAVQKLVSPSPQIPYITSLEEIKYWSQYCIAGIGDPWTSNNRRPNRLFLLLRDTPHSSEGSTLEIELTLRIAYWRNLDVKLPQVWNEIFALEGSLSSSFFDYCVTTFSNFCRLQNWYKWGKEYSEMYLSVTAEVVRIASRRDDLTSQAVESLIQAYEALQIGYGNPNLSGRSLPHLIRPFPYGKAIENASDDNNAHELLPFLLSRNINSYPSAKRIMRAQEVIAMLWIRPTNPTIRNWDYLMQQPESINGDIVTRMDWVAEADRIPHIKEILGHLATAQSKDPSMGPLWRTTKAKQINDPHFVEALETFDVLMQQNCTSADHLAMISLVCQDLEIEQRPNFTNYFTLRRLESISRLSDPCLKVLANCARGIKYITSINPSEYDNDKRRDSWDRVGQFLLRQYTNNQQIPVLRLQASLWPMLYGQKWLYKRALEQPDFFVHLEHIFHYPVACYGCIDGPGHLLFHILDVGRPTAYLPMEHTVITSAYGTRNASLLLLLTTWANTTPGFLRDIDIFERTDENSLNSLEGMMISLKASQYQVLSMIWNSLGHCSTGHLLEIELVIFAVRKALELRHEPESTSIFAPLASQILDLSEMSAAQGKLTYSKRELVQEEASKISRLLLTNLASHSIFGRGNGRSLSCAKATGVDQPALQWRRPYLE